MFSNYNYKTHHYDCYRNPEQSKRISFEAVGEALMMDDKKLLSWSEAESEVSSASKLVGSPLEDGHHLYKDLQNTYNSTSSEITL